MRVSEFNDKYLSTRIIFNTEGISKGQVIKVYKCDILNINGDFIHTGLIESVDKLRIKYLYFNEDDPDVQIGYILADDIPVNIEDGRWESDETYYIFEVIE